MHNAGTALLALALFFGAGMAPSPAPAQDLKTVERMSYEQALSTYRDCGLRKRAVDAFVQRMPRAAKAAGRDPTATINVNYSPDFPAEARAAFSRAVEAWEVRIASPVPIELNARWEALGGNTLGAAGPLFTLVDTNADGSGDTILGFPLYDALTGQDQAPGEPDIVARFNSTRTDWHFGEGPAPSGTLDFTSIVLHEIAHGLGYVDFFYQGTCQGQPTAFTVDTIVTDTDKVTQYHWAFGNGETTTGMNPLYTYPVAGTFAVTLTFTLPACGGDSEGDHTHGGDSHTHAEGSEHSHDNGDHAHDGDHAHQDTAKTRLDTSGMKADSTEASGSGHSHGEDTHSHGGEEHSHQ